MSSVDIQPNTQLQARWPSRTIIRLCFEARWKIRETHIHNGCPTYERGGRRHKSVSVYRFFRCYPVVIEDSIKGDL